MSRCLEKLSADCICEISFSLRWYVKIILQMSRLRFDDYFGVFGDGTRLAMPKTRLHVGLIVIEAWFRGY